MDVKEELAALRKLFKMLTSGRMRIHENNCDVTEREIEKLKPDIVYLERIIAHPHDWYRRPPYESDTR
jgi:hypothetical protein